MICRRGFANSSSKHGGQAELVLLNQNKVIWKEEIDLFNQNDCPAFKQLSHRGSGQISEFRSAPRGESFIDTDFNSGRLKLLICTGYSSIILSQN